MTRLRTLVLLLLLALLPLTLAPSPTAAQTARSVTWDHFDVTIDVLPDGTLRVTQREQISFGGSFRSAFREIPFERLTSITEVQVGEPGRAYQQGYGDPYTFSASRSDGLVRIQWWFPPTANASRTFELSYRVSGALRVYPDGDQLWWTVAYPGLWQSLQQSSLQACPPRASDVAVRLPQDVPTDELKAAMAFGADERPAASVGPREVRFSATDLPADKPFEVRVQFPHGLVSATAPPWQADFDRQRRYDTAIRPVVNLLLLVLSLAILIVGPLLLLLRWYAHGRDPAVPRSRAQSRRRPATCRPASSAPWSTSRPTCRTCWRRWWISATAASFRSPRATTRTWPGSSLDYTLELLKERPLGLRPFEQTIVATLFAGATSVRLSSVKQRWASSFKLFQDQLHDEVVRDGLFTENPQKARQRGRRLALWLFAIALAGGFLVNGALGWAGFVWLPFVALFVRPWWPCCWHRACRARPSLARSKRLAGRPSASS